MKHDMTRQMADLTPRQQETLDWIRDFIAKHSMPPTVREIGGAFDIKSSTVFALLKALERKGYLRRGNMGSRSLILEGQDDRTKCEKEDVPLIGRIAAGQPIEAIEDHEDTISVDKTMLKGRKGYALQVQGSSMIEAGILDGDYVIIRKQNTVDNGDIVVALIEGEATLKRFYREAKRVRLEPANKKLSPIYVGDGDFKIQGKMVGVIRFIEG